VKSKIIEVFKNFICTIGLIIISPFLVVIGFLIFCEDGLPIFFSQERYGLNKKIFKIYKIRTLKKDTPQLGSHEIHNNYKLRSGTLARNIKLDEFPQLINVIKGDINLIGPRPGLISQKELTEFRSAKGIYEIKPGITGLSQVLGYDMSDPIKLAEVDKLYIENKSIYMDLLILLGTFLKFPKNYLIKLVT